MGFSIKTPLGNINIGKSSKNDRPGTHKVQGQKVYDGMDSQYKDAKASLQQLEDLKQQIKDNPNMSDSEKRAALTNVERGISAAKEALDFSTEGATYDTTSGSVDGDADMGAARAALMDAHMAINAARDDIRAARPSTPATVDKMDPPVCDAKMVDTSGASGTSKSDGSARSGRAHSSSASGSSTGIGAMEIGGKSVNEMMEMMNNDPQALMDHLSGLETEDRQMAMQMIQQRLQEINQMFSMLSNMQKAAHDTAKASINNMRV